jgi:hypothetical protein
MDVIGRDEPGAEAGGNAGAVAEGGVGLPAGKGHKVAVARKAVSMARAEWGRISGG